MDPNNANSNRTARTPGTFRVVIVGGSIAGLTLAHSLHRAGIDYVLLEARDKIDPQVGASIGLFSNGSRVLDQLGVYKIIEEHFEPPVWHNMLTGEGELVQKQDSLELIELRTGYPVAFLERRKTLQILYNSLPEKSKVFTGKKVVSVDTNEKVAKVRCADGTEYTGDLVAGADGVHSTIKREMWRLAEQAKGEGRLKHLTEDKKAMSSEYRCLFGMSSPVPGLLDKEQYRTFNKNWSFLVVVGKNSRVYWFVFEKLDKKYQQPNIPRYYNQEADQAEFVKPFLSRYVNEGILFNELWERRTATTLTALEEAVHHHWAFERIVCLGDSIHKMTPNIGQGGNWAIESAAALTNELHALMKSTSSPTLAQLQTALKAYEESRHARTKEVVSAAGLATRVEAFANPLLRLFAMYVAPNAGDILVDMHCEAVCDAPRLDFLPLPRRCLQEGTIFHSQAAQLAAAASKSRMTPKKETPALRALYALPILAISFILHRYRPQPAPISAPETRLETLALLSTLVSLQTIGTIESLRRANNFTFGSLWPAFFFFGHFTGGSLPVNLGYTIPVYFFLHHLISSPQSSRLLARDNRMVPTGHAKTILAGVVVGYVLPVILSGTGPLEEGLTFKLAPLATLVSQRIFSWFVTDTTAQDRLKNPTADVPWLKRAYQGSAAISGLGYWYSLYESGGNLRSLVEPVTAVGYTHLAIVLSGLVFTGLHFRDLKKSGRLDAGWGKLLGLFVGTAALFGPGAALVGAWGWRDVLFRREGRIPEAVFAARSKVEIGNGVGNGKANGTGKVGQLLHGGL
ncbi:hypothetical protein QBC37DRAFT_322572 [Rhypophila decipiens]|uniref:FAD-binding domain-containing protein n=1 Tax=Rhypophila decipiens TaxID=261697 RepID=A0AAN6Y2U8_9PEZI|nr:hypothetical protein QBC37DRAFT_322572 [Rhypophila decipiens]